MRSTLVLPALLCAAAVFAACEGATTVEPDGARYALCSWDGECGPDRDPGGGGDTATVPVAEFKWSTTGYLSISTRIKQAVGTGRSEAIKGIAVSTVSAEMKGNSDCSNNWMPHSKNSSTQYGSPAVAEVNLIGGQTPGYRARFKMWSTHTFTAANGYSLGRTVPIYTAWDSGCF